MATSSRHAPGAVSLGNFLLYLRVQANGGWPF
jgi:hypothetical protein